MSKQGPGGSLQKDDPDKTGGYHINRPTGRPSVRPFPSVPLVVSVRRVPRPNRTLGTCALRALRCVASRRPHPLALVACGCSGLASVYSAVVSVFPPTLPFTRETEAGMSVWCCCKSLWWLFVCLAFCFFSLFYNGIILLEEGRKVRKEGKKYALSLLSLRLWSLQLRIVGGGEVCFVGRVEEILCPSLWACPSSSLWSGWVFWSKGLGTGFVQGEGEGAGAVTVSTTFGLKEKKTVVEFCGGEGLSTEIDRLIAEDRYGPLWSSCRSCCCCCYWGPL